MHPVGKYNKFEFAVGRSEASTREVYDASGGYPLSYLVPFEELGYQKDSPTVVFIYTAGTQYVVSDFVLLGFNTQIGLVPKGLVGFDDRSWYSDTEEGFIEDVKHRLGGYFFLNFGLTLGILPI